VVAVRDNPRFDFPMPGCIQQHGADSARCSFFRDDACSAVPPYATAAGVPAGVTFVDTADAVCGATTCSPTVGSVHVYLDDNHLTRSCPTTMAGRIEDQFVAVVGK